MITRFFYFSLQLERVSRGINLESWVSHKYKYKYRFQALLGSQFRMCCLRSRLCSTTELPDCPKPRPRGLEQLMEWKIVEVVLSLGMAVGHLDKTVPETIPQDYSHSSCKGLTGMPRNTKLWEMWPVSKGSQVEWDTKTRLQVALHLPLWKVNTPGWFIQAFKKVIYSEKGKLDWFCFFPLSSVCQPLQIE